MDAEITKMIAISEQIAAQHMDFIKSDGKKGAKRNAGIGKLRETGDRKR